jgi:peptide/nickel transport system ATP-binding protein
MIITKVRKRPSIDLAAEAGDADGTVARVEDLHVSFTRSGQQIRALRGVSLELRAGEIFGLVGESGSGKSVLGLSLLALPPQSGDAPRISGSINVCGVDVLKADDSAKRRLRSTSLGAVFQDPMTSLNPTMRVDRQLLETCGSKAEALRLLDAVGVPNPGERLRSFPHELSGGLRQRVMIAMALGGSPRLVLVDEPTTALDVTVQAQILDLLRRLCDELGTTFLFITHDLAVAGAIADRIGVLYGGRMAEVGPAAEILGSPRHPYTQGLLASRLTLDTVRGRPLLSLAGEPPDPQSHPPGCPFAPRCNFAIPECSAAVPPLQPVELEPNRWSACIRRDALVVQGYGSEPSGSAPRLTAAPPGGTEVSVDFAGAGASRSAPRAPALKVDDVHKWFSVNQAGSKRTRLHALRGVSLSVDEGQSVALVGESGCGKSTLLRVVAGLAQADGGGVAFGRPGGAQMVFQDAGASLTPWMTVGELLEDRLRRDGVSGDGHQRRIIEMLRTVGLPAEVRSARSKQLSGGQRQRVALARAMIVPPEVLLCDEPTSALDVSLAATVLNLLGRLRQESGTSMLFVTHDLGAARYVADRIVVMYLGEIVEEGPADRLIAHPRHPYTEALLSAVPGRQGDRVKLAGDPASAARLPAGCSFHPRCQLATDACARTPPSLTPKADSSGSVRCLVRS